VLLAWPKQSHQQTVHYWHEQAAERLLFRTLTALEQVQQEAEASALLKAICLHPGVTLADWEQPGWEVFHQLLLRGKLPSGLCTEAHH
jgi:hypothetical protein